MPGLDENPELQLPNVTLKKSFMQSYVCREGLSISVWYFYETVDRWRLALNLCPAEISVFLLAG